MPEPRCPVCEDPRSTVELPGVYPILRCGGCGLVYTDARGAPDGATLYPPFEQRSTPVQAAVRDALSVFTAARARIVESVNPRGRVLDYGAGSGAFARFVARRGHEAVGIEPYSLGAPVEEPGLRLVRAPLATLRDERFDVITLWHVLEHVADPVGLLRSLVALLADGGALVISVPNYASWQRQVFGARWFHLDPPRHLVHFEPDTLDATLARAGLRVDARFPDLAEYGGSGWVQSALNVALPHPNFLYEWVKDRGALAGVARPKLAAWLGVSAALGGPLFAGSLGVEALAARRRADAAITVVAHPR